MGALALLAVLFDMAVIWQFPPALDRGQTYFLWPLIANVAHGTGYVACNPSYFLNCESTNQVTAMYEPVPVLVFAALAALTHDSLWVVAGFQALVAVVTLVGLAMLTRQLAGPRTALVAGAIWAVYLPALRLVPEAAADLLGALGATCGVLAFMHARRTDRKVAWAVAGVAIGLGTLSRSAVLVLALTLVAGLLLWERSPAGRGLSWRLQRSLLVLAACAVVQVPWLVRNELAFGRPILGSTLVGYNLLREAHALTTPDYARRVSVNEGVAALHEVAARRPDLNGSENEGQLDTVYREEALSIIAAHPLRYVVSTADRMFMLWFNSRASGSEAGGASLADAMAYLPNVQQVLILAAAVVGFAVSSWHTSWPLVLTLVVYCLAHMAVGTQQRYLVPVMPLVIALAAVGWAHAVERLRRPAFSVAGDAPWLALVRGFGRLEQETYALYLAARNPRATWSAFSAVVAGVVLSLEPLPNPVKSLPALDRVIDVAPMLFGIIVARRLLPPAKLRSYRAEAQGALAAHQRRPLLVCAVAWVAVATLTLVLLIWNPV
jgi:4-amino-4-deoxy-L-arabinose transferase-like glycosyltransferase